MVEPVSYSISTFKTRTLGINDKIILAIVKRVFDCRPGAIIHQFSLHKPSFKYEDLASYGHIGRLDIDLPWERIDKVDVLKQELAKFERDDANVY